MIAFFLTLMTDNGLVFDGINNKYIFHHRSSSLVKNINSRVNFAIEKGMACQNASDLIQMYRYKQNISTENKWKWNLYSALHCWRVPRETSFAHLPILIKLNGLSCKHQTLAR